MNSMNEQEQINVSQIDIQCPVAQFPQLPKAKFFRQLNKYQSYATRVKQKRKSKQLTFKEIQIEQKKQQQPPKVEFMVEEEVMKNGNKIIGAWKNQKLQGHVIIEYYDGAFFEGQYQNGIRIKGKFKFVDGHEYEGNFLWDEFNGQGTLRYPNGKIIIAQWNQGAIEGQAQIIYPNKDVYYGPVQNFKKHGFGYLFFVNGNKYIGQFEDGQIKGQGSFYQNDALIAEGIWQKGKLIEEKKLKHNKI